MITKWITDYLKRGNEKTSFLYSEDKWVFVGVVDWVCCANTVRLIRTSCRRQWDASWARWASAPRRIVRCRRTRAPPWPSRLRSTAAVAVASSSTSSSSSPRLLIPCRPSPSGLVSCTCSCPTSACGLLSNQIFFLENLQCNLHFIASGTFR